VRFFPRFASLLAAALFSITCARAQEVAGPFTQQQAVAGRTAFMANCTGCHGATMDGGGGGAPALTGPNFQEDWLNKSAGQLFRFASTNMPLNMAGLLSRDTYIDLVSFILAVNGAKPGAVAFTGDSDVRIGTIADGRTVAAVLYGEGPYAPPSFPAKAGPAKGGPAKRPAKKRR
jgi:mono/diheme cytochrome c family protein